MPGPEFFRSLGLFILDDFFELSQCAHLRTEMRCAPAQQGIIFGNTPEGSVDRNVRQVLRTEVTRATRQFVRERLEVHQPRLEEHFGTSLQPKPSPEFLIYNSGGFYVPHTDAERTNESNNRSVSVVIFLNEESDQPKPDCHGGGRSTFHGVLNDRQWANCAFSIASHPGLLVAFRSELVHEVTPVIFGQRFTIVSWFLAAEISKDNGTVSSRARRETLELQESR